MLLQLISMYNDISGYEINKYVKQAEYHKWAKIGQTSLYTGLKSLEKNQLITSEIASSKQGKGPLPYQYKITSSGAKILHDEMIDVLATSREGSVKFDLALSAIQLLDTAESVKALEKRVVFLQSELNRISGEFIKRANCLELGPNFLYQHIMHSIKSEIAFTKKLI
jgi:DNA-binding PadR family transcriptional regulator